MKTALILGATSDIAIALAQGLAKWKYDLQLAGRDLDTLHRLATDLEIRHSIKTQVCPLNALSFDSHAAFWDSLNPKPSGVVCALGYLGDQQYAQSDLAETSRIIDTNLTACVRLLNMAAEYFDQVGQGFIIGISSVAGDRGRASNYLYGAAKAGFSEYLSGLRNRFGRTDIRVITVKPGFVDTRMTENLVLPPKLTATPETVSADILKGMEKGKDVLYIRWFWRFIMLTIIHLPERVFKRLSL